MPDQGICTLSGSVTEPETHAQGEHLLVRYASKENATAWDKLTDSLIAWGLRSAEDDDDGLEWPSRSLLASAYRLACKMRNTNVPAPSNTVPNGEGGIAFEWRAGPFFTKIEVGKDGSLEFLSFNHGKLVCRGPLPLS
jgi:hypothetical protein